VGRDARRFDRRTLLAAAMAGGGAAVLAAASRGDTAAAGASLARAAASISPAGSDLGAIEHVVFLMQENRSFDHYFGTYPGVRGFDDRPGGNLGAFSQRWPGGRDSHLLPFHLDTASGIGECTFDLSHEWDAQHRSRGRGDNGAFVATHTRVEAEMRIAGNRIVNTETPQMAKTGAKSAAFTVPRYERRRIGRPPRRLYT